VDFTSTIVTDRLRLVSFLAGSIEALIDRDVDRARSLQGLDITEEFLESLENDFLSIQLDGVRARPSEGGWFVRAVVRAEDAAVIGHCGFHGPPEVVGRAEIGYNILQPYRGNSFATEVARGLVEWANQQGSKVVFAVALATNHASIRVLERSGFHQTGARIHEVDGEEYVFEIGGVAW
jgi:RimJ/RimL family protein N-acetyltransferase